jgi:hypothetical protein
MPVCFRCRKKGSASGDEGEIPETVNHK